MRNKKNFNNLLDSIYITFLLFFGLALCLLSIWFGVINPGEGENPFRVLILAILFFGPIIILTFLAIIYGCYEYWVLSEDSIYSKKPFRRKVVIKLDEIDKVEKKVVKALVLGSYGREAYIVFSKNKKIVILINERKKYFDLDFEMSKFIN